MRKLKWGTVMGLVIIITIYVILIGKQRQVGQDVDIETMIVVDEELLETPDIPITKEYTKYAVELSVDKDCHSFEGIVKILYTHQYDKPTKRILINAGSIEVQDIQINSSIVPFTRMDSIVMVQSPFEIKKDGEVSITIQFKGLFTSNTKNLTDMASVCNFIPTLPEYSEEYGWNRTNDERLDSLRLLEPADYEVTIHTYKGQYPIGTGTLNDVSEKDNMVTTSFSAKRVRGFGVFIGEHMEMEVFNTQEGYSIVLYKTPDSNIGKDTISMITKSLSNYCDTLGEYPYDQLTIIHKNGIGEGVAYPTLIVGDFREGQQIHDGISKLVGKQWLYYIIGSSKETSWLSEGLLAYLNKRFSFSQGQMESYIEEQKKINEEEKIVDSAENNSSYTTDELAIQMFYEIEEKIGRGAFATVLRAYYKDYSFQIPTGEEFIQLIKETTKIDVTYIYNNWRYKMEQGASEENESSCTSSR